MDLLHEFQFGNGTTKTILDCQDLIYDSKGDLFIQKMRSVMLGLCLVSTLGLVFVACTIFYNKKLQAHPQPMIAVICMVEALMSYNALIQVMSPPYVACYFKFNTILSWLIPAMDKQEALETLCISNQFFFAIFQMSSLILNLCLCLDLIMTIYSPFSPSAGRSTLYYLFTAIASITLIISLYYSNVNQEENCVDYYVSDAYLQVLNTELTSNVLVAMVYSTYIVIAIYSVVFSYRRLNRPGVSKEVRSLFFKKHFCYVVAFILFWTIQQMANYYILFTGLSARTIPSDNQRPSNSRFVSVDHLEQLAYGIGYRRNGMVGGVDPQDDTGNFLLYLSSMMCFCMGIFLTAIRLFEPLFRVILIKQAYEFFGDLYDEEKSDEKNKQLNNDSLSTFLNSSLNVELVFIILKSITTFSSRKNTSETLVSSDKKNNSSKHHKGGRDEAEPEPQHMHLRDIFESDMTKLQLELETAAVLERHCTLSHIEIKNLEMWNSGGQAKETIAHGRESCRVTTDVESTMSLSVVQEVNEEPQTGLALYKGPDESFIQQDFDANEADTKQKVINEDVQIVEYAPAIFNAIKQFDNVLPEHIRQSLSTDANRESVFKAKESAGKSGSFFFFSYDRRFIIKTMNNNELTLFKKALPGYFLHCRKFRKSMIARIYGIFTVQMEDIAPVNLLLMANAAQSGKDIQHIFDLKGSTVNREEKDPEVATKKDTNLIKMKKDSFLRFRLPDMKFILGQVRHDIRFLCGHNIMDYSLLLIIETNPEWVKMKEGRKMAKLPDINASEKASLIMSEEKSKSNVTTKRQLVQDFIDKKAGTRHKYISNDGHYIYHMAIIDYLQGWDLEKKGEAFLKVWIKQAKADKISACEPRQYAMRWEAFMKEQVIINGAQNGDSKKQFSREGSRNHFDLDDKTQNIH